MVFAAGCDVWTGNLILYDSFTKNKKQYKLKPLNHNDNVNCIDDFFKEIREKVDKTIDIFCVLMYSDYCNNFCKQFLEFSKIQSNIKEVRIIGGTQIFLCAGIEKLSFSPILGDWLYIFSCFKENIFCNVWKYDKEKHWKFEKTRKLEKAVKGLKKSPTAEELQKFKHELDEYSKIPYIFVYCECAVNENVFKTVFKEYKKIEFSKTVNFAEDALNYARYLLNESGYFKYKSDILLNRTIEIKMQNTLLFDNVALTPLPFKKTVNVNSNKNDVINVYESFKNTETIPIEKGNYIITLCVDINGIYTIDVCDTDKANDMADEKNMHYFIPKQVSNYNPELNAVGIDLGTSECCAAVIRKNGPDFVVLDETTSLRTMPSYIAFDEKEPKCGQIVVDRMRYKAAYSVYDSKRFVGKEYETISIDPLWPFGILNFQKKVFLETETFNGKKTKSPVEISAVLLEHIKTTTDKYQNEVLSDVVITIPSVFSETQKQATKTAAQCAGWKTIHFLPEPVAAAFAYFTEITIPNLSNILIFDCGGGTVDICIAKVNDINLEILCFDGDSYLGGRDFDNILFTYFNGILKHKYNFDVLKNSKKYIFKQKCQNIKHKLSASLEDWIDVDDFDPNIDEIIKITREEFEDMSLTLIVRMKNLILLAVTKSNIPKNQINYIFQVGGGCRMPMIKKLLLDIFPNGNHQCTIYPDWIVAHGAALYAYHLKTKGSTPHGSAEKPKTSWLNRIFS